MQCPRCQQENPAAANFCLHCGTKLVQVCPHCQHVSPPAARFCMACGQPLTARQRKKRRNGETGKRRRQKGNRGKAETEKRRSGETEKEQTTSSDARRQTPDARREEVLALFLEQIPTTRIFTVLTFRPDFTPLWGSRSYLTQLTLSRLGRVQVEAMVEKVTGGKALPAEVVQQIVAKTDGVPLFVEELTKMVIESIESVGSVESHSRTSLQAIAIPVTLHDSLMARLDRLGPAKEIAQVGATLGREFSYELLYAVSPFEEATLQQGLRQLVEAELYRLKGQLTLQQFKVHGSKFKVVNPQSLTPST